MPKIENLKPEDKFFCNLESNLENFINDRPAAYNFILGQLKLYQGKYFHILTAIFFLDDSNTNLIEQMKLLAHQNSILKKGIRIQNAKLIENDAKAKNFDQLLAAYQKLSEEKQSL